jgi:hypothetical protein
MELQNTAKTKEQNQRPIGNFNKKNPRIAKSAEQGQEGLKENWLYFLIFTWQII